MLWWLRIWIVEEYSNLVVCELYMVMVRIISYGEEIIGVERENWLDLKGYLELKIVVFYGRKCKFVLILILFLIFF